MASLNDSVCTVECGSHYRWLYSQMLHSLHWNTVHRGGDVCAYIIPPKQLLLRYCSISFTRLDIIIEKVLWSFFLDSVFLMPSDSRHRMSSVLQKFLFSLSSASPSKQAAVDGGSQVKGRLVCLCSLMCLDFTTWGQVELWNMTSEEPWAFVSSQPNCCTSVVQFESTDLNLPTKL